MPAMNQVLEIYLELGLWDKLDSTAAQALKIVPNDPGILKIQAAGKKRLTKIDERLMIAKENPTPENYLSLSLLYYQKGMFEKCIEACKEALKLKPNFADAYNNICSSYNSMGKYKEAAEACEKAIAIKPDYPLAKNNLNWAKSMIKK